MGKLKKITTLCFAIVFHNIYAQNISQLSNGNYNPLHSLQLNPSLNSFTSIKWQVNVAGFWVNANNNYLSLRLPYSAYRVPNNIPLHYQTESGNPKFDKSWMHENLNGKSKQLSIASDVYGPGFYIKLKHNWGIGLVTLGNVQLRGHKLSENLAHALFKELDSSQAAFSLFNKSISANNQIDAITLSANSRAQLVFNLSKKIELDHQRQLSFGISIKKQWGFNGAYYHQSEINTINLNHDSILIKPMNATFISYGDKIGKGWGTDIGATYLFKKKAFKQNGNYKKLHPDYHSKIGFAILDIGKINYQNAEVRTLNTNSDVILQNDNNFRNDLDNSDYEKIIDSVFQSIGHYSESNRNINIGLPSRISVSSDFQLGKHYFISTVLVQSLRKKSSIHHRYQSYLMASPRYETRYFEISLPVLLEYNYRGLRIGTSLRFGPLYIGSNNLYSFINTRNIKDVDLFAGINFSDFSGLKLGLKNKKSKAKKNGPLKCFNF